NKPLYSNKDAAKDAAKELSKEQSAAAKAPETAPPEAVTKPAEVKPEIKASVEKSVQKTVEAGKADSPDDKYIYFLQAGAFKEQSDAESARAKLALIGFEARVSEKTSDTGSVYRVRIGPFSQVEAMNRMRAKLSENGVDVAIVRTVK
ncbi:MAG: SPOR domain-containing protein, partial [Burkholderiales bacterium]|nr:SPOR domain-containing protein [Burkholderiales bacterium]